MYPVSTSLNAAVLHMANRVLQLGFDVNGIDTDAPAPTTLDELNKLLSGPRPRLVVSSAYSDNTIFGDPEINYAFRAWHDWTHYRSQAQFDLPGEILVCRRQLRDLETIYGARTVDPWRPWITAEVVGQAYYRELFNEFPTDQRLFDTMYVEMTALKRMNWHELREAQERANDRS